MCRRLQQLRSCASRVKLVLHFLLGGVFLGVTDGDCLLATGDADTCSVGCFRPPQ